MSDQELHTAASGYATRRMNAYTNAMKLGTVSHMTETELRGRWLSHYEGYREGYWVATGDTRFSTDPAKERNDE